MIEIVKQKTNKRGGLISRRNITNEINDKKVRAIIKMG